MYSKLLIIALIIVNKLILSEQFLSMNSYKIYCNIQRSIFIYLFYSMFDCGERFKLIETLSTPILKPIRTEQLV